MTEVNRVISVRYVGPFDEIEVVTPDGRILSAKPGDTIEVPTVTAVGDETHTGLLDQPSNWRPVKAKEHNVRR